MASRATIAKWKRNAARAKAKRERIDRQVIAGLLRGESLREIGEPLGITNEAVNDRLRRIAKGWGLGDGLTIGGLREVVERVQLEEREGRAERYRSSYRLVERDHDNGIEWGTIAGRNAKMTGKARRRLSEAETLQQRLDAWKRRYCRACRTAEERAEMEAEGVAIFDALVKAEGL